LRFDAHSYVHRKADRELTEGLLAGEFCYILTARQMGKSSLMVRATRSLRQRGWNVVTFDLAALGQQLTLEQWYDGLTLRLGQQLHLEDELDTFWCANDRFGPCQRFFAAIRDVVLPHLAQHSSDPAAHPPQGRLVIFVDELDVVRSLPFSSDEFFAAIRACYNGRTHDHTLDHLTFCLLGVATPAELMRDPHTTPFNLGQRIELHDFSPEEAAPLASRIAPRHLADPDLPRRLLDRVLYWTHGHPYLTQRLCAAVAAASAPLAPPPSPQLVDQICAELFLAPRAGESDDNLLFVRERLLRTEADLASLLELYENILTGALVPDDEFNPSIDQLRLAGIVRTESGHLTVRNRIYTHVFDRHWITATKPTAELELPNGHRQRLRGTCTLGRTDANDLVLPDAKVSRRHAVIHPQGRGELWLADLGSRNGTFLNGSRINTAKPLRHNDLIEIGPYRLAFRQPLARHKTDRSQTTLDRTVVDP
jgi:hypothetical protein